MTHFLPFFLICTTLKSLMSPNLETLSETILQHNPLYDSMEVSTIELYGIILK